MSRLAPGSMKHFILLTVCCNIVALAQQPDPPDNFAFMSQPSSFRSFQHMDQLGFRLDPVHKGARVYALKRPAESFSAAYEWQGTVHTLDDYFQRTFVLGFLILHGNQIVLEKYFHDADRESRFLSNSVAKSIVSVLVGRAVEDGKIHSVNDPVVRYLPYLASSGYKDATIKNVLQMSSGVKFDEVYLSPESDIGRFGNALLQGGVSFRDFAA